MEKIRYRRPLTGEFFVRLNSIWFGVLFTSLACTDEKEGIDTSDPLFEPRFAG
jgi:hypothetical protein